MKKVNPYQFQNNVLSNLRERYEEMKKKIDAVGDNPASCNTCSRQWAKALAGNNKCDPEHRNHDEDFFCEEFEPRWGCDR